MWRTCCLFACVVCLFRCVEELGRKLEFERERREGLEAEIDQLRKQLQQTTALLQKYQSVSSTPRNQVCL